MRFGKQMAASDIEYDNIKQSCRADITYAEFRAKMTTAVERYATKTGLAAQGYDDVKKNYLGCIKLLKKFERHHSLSTHEQRDLLSWLTQSSPFNRFADTLHHEVDRSYPQYVALNECSIIGHRAFDPYFDSLKQGFLLRTSLEYAEVDVCRCKSGEIILQHDRFALDGKPLEDCMLEDLYRPVLLEDLCHVIRRDVCAGFNLMIDIKGMHPLTVAGIVQALEKSGIGADSVLLASFSTLHVQNVHEEFSQYERALITANITVDSWLPFLKRCECKKIILDENIACRHLVVDYIRNDVEVWVYTVNDKGRLQSLVDMGVKGIITDVPNLLQN